MKVAVVEDEELIRTMLRLNLEGQGYEVDAYPNGEAFLEAFRQTRHDLVLLDIMLPE